MGTSWSAAPLKDNPIKASHIQELRNALYTEVVTRRKLAAYAYTDPNLATTSGIIKKLHVKEMTDKINLIKSGAITLNLDGLVYTGHITSIRTYINALENKEFIGGATDCSSGCVGLCVSCTGSCTGGCGGSCSGSCDGYCSCTH